MYAMLRRNGKIEMITSTSLFEKFPEALISFLENQIQFESPQPQLFTNENDDFTYVSGCTDQSGGCVKYLLSRNNVQFFGVIKSHVAAERMPDLVVQYLESKIDVTDCYPQSNNKRYGKSRDS